LWTAGDDVVSALLHATIRRCGEAIIAAHVFLEDRARAERLLGSWPDLSIVGAAA